MACISFRQASFKQGTAKPATRRAVRVMAVHQPNKPMTGFVAAAAAAVLLASSTAPALASPLNPAIPELAGPVGKLLNKLDAQDPPKGVPGPKVEGQFRANPAKARALALENSPAGSPEAEAKAARERLGK
ncbi:hypothetical protein OEZ86_006005 [Tetradesmus obliquus]|uniref:Uncharacterized protein n=1 Tax=Tetradesmus obliquus TaxID=3088 RepID=A0A383VWH1_TETOB|nr:hypothetical protein OEZ86_006005 [Tetradesmus obliquus]